MAASVHPLRKLSNGEIGAAVATPAMSCADAAYHTVHQYPGGAHALAARMPARFNARGEMTPMSGSTLQHKVNPNCTTHGLMYEEARDIMGLSGDYRMLHALASELGHVALKVSIDPGGVTAEKVMAATKEFGDLLSEVGRATSKRGALGEAVSRNELSRIEREACELIGALNALVCNLRAQAGGRS